MNRQPVFVRRTVNGVAHWVNVPTVLIRLSVWATLLLPVALLALIVKVVVS
jgi:hypothetical protein